jgi:hypothetical protein
VWNELDSLQKATTEVCIASEFGNMPSGSSLLDDDTNHDFMTCM